MTLHPLNGSNPATLIALLQSNWPIPPKNWGKIALALSASLARSPFSWLERGLVPFWRQKMPGIKEPIFIVGHWRSGTTHLYNVMTRSGRFGFVPPLATGMPWDMLVLTRMLHPLLIKLLPQHRFIDRIPVNPDSPQEDEAGLANMQEVSFYHGLYFPQRLRAHFMAGVFFDDCSPSEVERWCRRFVYFHEKIHVLNHGRQLLIKNPVYTARIAMLRQIFPTAKFIHVYRDPIEVFASMRFFYFKLLEAMALQDYEVEEVERLVLETYPRMMNQLIQDTAALPRQNFVEIAYHNLEQQPLLEIQKIYEGFGIDGYDEDRPAFENYLDSIRGYQKNHHALPEQWREQVADEWEPFIERWGQQTAV